MTRTRLQISAECVARWADDGEAAVAAEELLYWKARDAIRRGDVETAGLLLSAMRYVGTQARVLPSLMANEARVAMKFRAPM